MALILEKLGFDCILLEKANHPRFAIGESSIPLANLSLETICNRYGLQHILPLTKYGTWQKNYPGVSCGLKRGTSLFKHNQNQPFKTTMHHEDELLVAASPNNRAGDTHWFREIDFLDTLIDG